MADPFEHNWNIFKSRSIVESKVNHFLLYWMLMNSNCKKKNDNGLNKTVLTSADLRIVWLKFLALEQR